MKRIVFLLALIFFTSVIVHLPLAFVAKYLPKIPQVVLANPSGSVWRGTFSLVQWENTNLGSLNWEFKPFSIFTGSLSANIVLDGADISAKGFAGVSFSGAFVNDLNLTFPSAFVDPFIQSPVPFDSMGNVSFNITNYVIASSPWCEQLNGQGRWDDAAVNLPFGSIDLGFVNASLSCQSGSIFVNSTTNSTSLETNFSFSLSPQNNYTVDGDLAPKENLPQAIRSQLQWLGAPDNQGRYSLQFSG